MVLEHTTPVQKKLKQIHFYLRICYWKLQTHSNIFPGSALLLTTSNRYFTQQRILHIIRVAMKVIIRIFSTYNFRRNRLKYLHFADDKFIEIIQVAIG